MQESLSGMEMLLGDRADILGKAKIAVFGLGGAGSSCAEALARCGTGSLILVDPGKITDEDIDSQLFALRTTVGQSRVFAAKERLRSIDGQILVHTYETHFTEETAFLFDFGSYDFVVDAMEEAQDKITLIRILKEKGIPFVSCMDVNNRLDPSKLEAGDIARAAGGTLAKAVRVGLKKNGIQSVRTVYSKERPLHRAVGRKGSRKNGQEDEKGIFTVFVPFCAGMILAAEAVNALTGEKEPRRLTGDLNFGILLSRRKQN